MRVIQLQVVHKVVRTYVITEHEGDYEQESQALGPEDFPFRDLTTKGRQ